VTASATVPSATGVSTPRVRRRVVVRGVVQGVGFRPFVYVTASELSLTGSVANDSHGVVIEVEGPSADADELVRRLSDRPPPLAIVESVQVTSLPVRGGTGFAIAGSSRSGGTRTLASPDVATCDDCLRELADPADRRYRHPFITCTNCGPRFTIITGLPYDRPSTTMAGFAMCAECAAEYGDPADRRFHAQPIACPRCGPRLELVTRDPGGDLERATDAEALQAARRLLSAGAVVAVKGLGGYHLACDGADDDAVATLRERKRRGDKPFAVMVADLDAARRLVDVDDVEAALLTSPRRPIVLLRRRGVEPGGVQVSDGVAPRNPDLGVMLPYTPVHTLLFGLASNEDEPGPRVLVMTSGNLAGEPIAFDDDDARSRLAPLADAWLRHDRPIRVPCDDSVTRVVDGEEVAIRRSRGYAPLPLSLPVDVGPTLAVGADLKNACCVADGRYAWLSQHIGDMDDLSTLAAFTATERHLETLTGVRPATLVADRHPGYRSSGWARAHRGSRPLRTVQHHHAHVAAVMAEHGLDGSQPVIGVCFDGTGYGDDGAVWGGEVLLADYKGFRRLAHLGYVPLPGGDVSVQRPYRMALAHLAAAGVPWDADLAPVAACPEPERGVLSHQIATGFGCTPTSSMGRLFDAVASVAGVRHSVDYEAQAAIELEAQAHDAGADAEALCYALPLVDGLSSAATVQDAPLVADPTPLVRAVVADARSGVSPGVIGRRFHGAVVGLVRAAADRAREGFGVETVALTGGVFQNALLLSGARRTLRADGFTVLCHRRVPPNDGGLALGQVMVGSSR
jgi:hydrogenase maturation protein HypF